MTDKYRLPEQFFTERLDVRRVQPGDAAAMFAGWTQDGQLARYMTWKPHRALSETQAYAEYAHREWEGGQCFPAVVRFRDRPDQLIGSIEARVLGTRISWGWLVRRDHWGKGIASEMAQHVIAHALAHRTIFRVEAVCDCENPASARVMEKAGMQKEGRLARYIMHPNVSDEPRDAFLYAKVR